MRYIIAGTEEIYYSFCFSHKIAFKDATYLRNRDSLRMIPVGTEIILTCRWGNIGHIFEITDYLRAYNCTFIKIPCCIEPVCPGIWDRITLDA